jgi:hypothetical protein
MVSLVHCSSIMNDMMKSGRPGIVLGLGRRVDARASLSRPRRSGLNSVRPGLVRFNFSRVARRFCSVSPDTQRPMSNA